MSLYRAIRQYAPLFKGKTCDACDPAEADYQASRIMELQAQLVLAYDELLAERHARAALEQAIIRYGRHDFCCYGQQPGRSHYDECNCGFSRALLHGAGEGKTP